MEIQEARFIISNTDYEKCPQTDKPEYAFTGRSNVGKSSLINMLTNHRALAKISGKPGKTRLINHFLINKDWYLVDLPGYGYAKIAKQERKKWENSFRDYILFRENLFCLFVLIDARHEPQPIDLSFMEWLGMNQVPFAMVFTKIDKLKPKELEENIQIYQEQMLKSWESLPSRFFSSAKTGAGRAEILDFIESINKQFKTSDPKKTI